MGRHTNPVIEAFLEGKVKKISNTETDGSNLYLFGNCIAKRGVDGNIFISDGGYNHTITTASRLNILGAKITLRKGQFYKDGVEWSGKWTNINETPCIKKEQEKQLFR